MLSAALTREGNPSSGTLYERFFWRGIDDLLVIVDLRALEFTILNKTAATVWLCLLDEEWYSSDLNRFLGDTYSNPTISLTSEVDALLETWGHLEWIKVTEDGALSIPSKIDIPPPPPYKTVPEHVHTAAVSSAVPEWSRTMDFIGKTIKVQFYCDPGMAGSDISNRAIAFLDGLPQVDDPVLDQECINCYITSRGIFLRLGESRVEALDVSDGLSRLVLWCFYQAYGSDNFLGTFHAAALGRDGGAILMPGLSGAGKSTLTAYLSRNGWLYGGDDIIGLSKPAKSNNDYHVLPFCSAVSVKDGSLDILSEFYPGLRDLPSVQYDVKSARFPCVPTSDHMTTLPRQRLIKAIVFPAYHQSSQTNLVPLSIEETLLCLVGVGFRTGEQMSPSLLNELFEFLELTPKYRLEFSSMDEAGQCLEGLL